LADAADIIKAGGSLKRVAEECPLPYIRYHRGLEKYHTIINTPVLDDKGFKPRPWQDRVLHLLGLEANDRTVVWVHETVGNIGKSRLCRHLCIEKGGVFLTGKLADMCHAFEHHPIACFDITRAQAEFSDHVYTMCEWLKNGGFMKTKYESRQHWFKPPHVIIFSNGLPGEGKWSQDRLKMVNLEDPEWHQETILAHVRRVEGNTSPPGSPQRLFM